MSAIRRRIAAVLAFALVIAGLEATAAMATAPVEAPVLTRPAEGSAVSANPVLAWDAVPDAVRYRVELSTSPAFTPLSYAVTTYARHATPPTDLPLGTLHWRVRGLDSG